MPKISNYCKAYPIQRLREFSGWTENFSNLCPETISAGDPQISTPPVLSENCFLYLHENYIVTYGVFVDEDIIFDKVTPEWPTSCQNVLRFDAPGCDL